MLTYVFAVEIAAVAVMSNHYHLVVHIDLTRANFWSEDAVMKRWSRLFRGPLLMQAYLNGKEMTSHEPDKRDYIPRSTRKPIETSGLTDSQWRILAL